VNNSQIADRLEALGSLLELSDANPYTVCAYRRAAETIRGAPLPVAELVRSGRARELRGIGAGVETRLCELVNTGEIAELAVLERELAPDLVGLARYLGLSAKRSIGLARSLDVHTAEELREAATEGRLRTVPGIGPKTEARLLDALAREAEPRLQQGLLLSRARELVVAEPERFGTALIRATGSRAYVAALEPLPDGPDETAVFRTLEVPWCPPELREGPFRGKPPNLVEPGQIRGDLHCHSTWSDGRATIGEMARAAQQRGYDYLAICDHTPAVGAVRGLTADDVRRQGEEIGAANELLEPFRVLRGIECDILPDGRLDLPDDVLAELDWVQASVHAGQRTPRRELTKRVEEALRNPYVRCLSHPKGRIVNRRAENALDLERVFDLALRQRVAVEVNGLPARLDLRGEHVRDALRAGVRIVCSTDAHSVRGLENMALSVATARRGWARAADVVNTRPLAAILDRGRGTY
jgi:DNA polymerase (family 10)